MEYKIFSKRQQRIQGEIPDTDESESIPKELRVQIVHIWRDILKSVSFQSYNKTEFSDDHDAYKTIYNELCREYGRFALDEDSNFYQSEIGDSHYQSESKSYLDSIVEYFLEINETEMVIDVIEVSFRYIDQVIRDKFPVPDEDELDEIDKALGISRREIPSDAISPDAISPDEAINQLNDRFSEHSVWYQYESGQIVKVDSQGSPSEVVKPAEELPNNTQQPMNADTMNNKNKTIFIGHGHSPIWREAKDFITETLGLEYEEFDRISAAGKFINNRLEEMLGKSCMAFLIMTGEDEHLDGSEHARQNVIHEIGKCQDRFGSERAIILLEKGCQEFSNIDGIVYIDFAKGNIKEAFGDIVKVLIRESIIRIELCN